MLAVLLPVKHSCSVFGSLAVQPNNAAFGKRNWQITIPARRRFRGNQRIIRHREVRKVRDSCAGDVIVLKAQQCSKERSKRHSNLRLFGIVNMDLYFKILDLLLCKHEPQMPHTSRAAKVQDVNRLIGRHRNIGG